MRVLTSSSNAPLTFRCSIAIIFIERQNASHQTFFNRFFFYFGRCVRRKCRCLYFLLKRFLVPYFSKSIPKIYFYKEVANAVRAQQSIKFNLFHIVDCVTCFLFFWQLLHFPMAAAGFSLVARRISPQIFRSFSPKINLQQARRTVPLNELCRSTFALQHRLRYDSIKVRFLLVIQNIANHFSSGSDLPWRQWWVSQVSTH